MANLLSRLYDFVTDKTNGVKILSAEVDAEFDQLVAAINRNVLCASSAPSSPIAGQTWVDTTNKVLKLYRNNEWVVMGAVHISSTGNVMATPQEGDLWYDTTLNTLQYYTGAAWVVIGNGDVLGPASNTANNIPQWNGANSKTLKDGLALDTDGTLAANSDSNLPSQKAVKTYADGKAAKGANSDITSLSALSTALSVAQGGTGQTSFAAAGLARMATGTYTGDGAATKAIIGVGFQPKVLIIFSRSAPAGWNIKTDQDTTYTTSGDANVFPRYAQDVIISLDADGFTVGDGTGADANWCNTVSVVHTYIAWG